MKSEESGEIARVDLRERDRERPRWQDVTVTSAQPLLRPVPRSAMFFPLVVLVAVLPGLSALNNWDLTPPGPWWGLRGLAVLEGYVLDQVPAAASIGSTAEASAFRTVAGQPPLYAWLEAVGLALGNDHDPLATVLPSYAAGAVVVVLVYLHGRLWRGAGVGLVAAVLTGFNRNLLVQMQQATPTTLALAGALGVLFCYGEHLRRSSGSSSGALGRDGFLLWGALGGLCLGISLTSVGLFGLATIPVMALHQSYLGAGVERPSSRRGEGGTPGSGRRLPSWLSSPSFLAGVVALLVALALAAPWYVVALRARGTEALSALVFPLAPDGRVAGSARPLLLGWMIRLAPGTLPQGLYAAARSV
ncbi:MAG: glycosyltransferase family 39 protein, partial [Isosphaeraceae bacterium]